MCAFRTSVARELTATAPHVLLGVSQTSPVTGLRIPLHWSALRVIALVYPAETVRVARFAVRTLTETGVLLVASKITSSLHTRDAYLKASPSGHSIPRRRVDRKELRSEHHQDDRGRDQDRDSVDH